MTGVIEAPSAVMALAAMVVATIVDSVATPLCAQENAGESDFSREVDIGGGRHLFLECRGSGRPTVILESGYHDSSDPWSLADSGPPATMDRIATFTRVCAYDRPGTLRYSDSAGVTERSSPVAMPRTAQDVVSDLHALLAAAEVPGPYFLVAHSMGGIFARLYAQTYPEQVTGMVMVDAFPIELPELLGEDWEAYRRILDNPVPQFADDPHFERIDVEASVAEVEAAPPLKRMPLAVITKGEPFALPPGASQSGFPFAKLERLWPIGAKALVALEPHTPHVIVIDSDHYIQVHHPDLIAEATRRTIQRVGEQLP